uniref:Uncharacterized protein n=1 Tax=Piliocolobus tephrosceles TaxID=591936 RepID=A0A8C9IQC8_9PRIM
MVTLGKEAKQRLQWLFKGSQFSICWGFIRFMTYLELKKSIEPGMSEPIVLNRILWDFSASIIK